jgi:hypothetical protein
MWEFNREVHVLFIDFKKAYDCIHIEFLLNVLRQFKLPQKLINLIKANILHTEIKIKVGNILSQGISVSTDLRQGDALSSILFNIALEKVIRESHIEENGVRLGGCKIGVLAYADDIVLLTENKENLREQAGKLLDTAKRIGLEINTEKTEYLIMQRGELADHVFPFLEVEQYKFQRVREFIYLGSILTEKNDELTEIKARLQSGNKCYYRLSNLLKTRMISKNLKIQLYRTLIRPVVMYGCEVWTLRKSEQNRLLIFERKILRRIFGPCKDDTTGEWRIRKNKEFKQLYQMLDIIREIKKKETLMSRTCMEKRRSSNTNGSMWNSPRKEAFRTTPT